MPGTIEELWRHGGEVVISDPRRGGGAPRVESCGLKTEVLWRLYEVERDYGAVADWHEVPVSAVRCAVAFERARRRRIHNGTR